MAANFFKSVSTTSEEEKPSKKPRLEDFIQNQEKSLTPRDYQIEILKVAKRQNTIACLGTGTGKTFIAVMLIREFADDVRLPFDEKGKRIFFLVPTVPLVHQQGKTISEHTDLKVKGFCGDMYVDSWNPDKWTEEFRQNEILVMTAEIFKNIVIHNFIPLNKIRLIIFDECHRAQGNHPYCQVMKCFTTLRPEEMPRIFGLSASLINGKCKPTQLEKQLKDLEITLRSSITTASDIVDLQKFGADPKEYVTCYKPFNIETDLFSRIDDMKKELSAQKSVFSESNETASDSDLEFFDRPSRCLTAVEATLRTLGSWCASKAAYVFKEEISQLVQKPVFFQPEERAILQQLYSFLDYFIIACNSMNFQFSADNLEIWPHKLKRLLDILLAARDSDKFLKGSAPVLKISFQDDPEKYHKVLQTKEGGNESELQLCSIVFVQHRITAYILQKWLLEIKKIFPQLSYLNPGYIVGHGNTFAKMSSMSERQQKNVLSDFRNKKFNILISTCVLEEGMDVQQCNLVVRFDLPSDFRAYVQSKGRARAKNSIYILMSEVGVKHAQFCHDMCNFKSVEKMLMDKCHNRSVPSEEEIRDKMVDSMIPPYMPYGEKGPRITLLSAMSLINRYCKSLPCDMATKLTAKWNVRLVNPDSPVKEYECILKMPINSPLKTPITGQKMRQKRLAKMSAAFEACKQLGDIGELNEHLIPVSSMLQQKLDDEIGVRVEEEMSQNGAAPGTSKNRKIYHKHVPIFLQNCQPQPGCPSYLHIFKTDLVEPLPDVLNPRKRPIKNPEDSPKGLGILLSKKLPKVNSFPVFTKLGKIAVSVSLCDKVFVLSPIELKAIEEFHQFVFSDPLYLDKDKTFSPASSEMPVYVVPISREDTSSWIDWLFMDYVKNHSYNGLKISTSLPRTKYEKTLFRDAVLVSSYKMVHGNPPIYHHIMRVTDMTPNSSMDGSSDDLITYKNYFQDKHGIEILDDQQPVVETYTNAGKVNWKPLYISSKSAFDDSQKQSKTKQRRMEYHEYLVPELCLVHPFPSLFFFKVQILPTILFRLRSLLLAEELRQNVARSGLVGTVELPLDVHWPYFNLETSDKELRKHLRELKQYSAVTHKKFLAQDIVKAGDTIVSFTREVNLHDHLGPSPCLLLQALTSRSTGDEFDFERLEMIGDSFLKYVISVKTYIKYPTFDEGKLSMLRSSLIQNLHLYLLAKKKNLGEFLICSTFDCDTTFLPPCYTVNEEVDKRILNTKAKKEEMEKLKHLFFTKQIISDKCIADVVEALVGAYLLSCGQKGAIMFMHWMGLDPLPYKKEVYVKQDFLNWPPKATSVIVSKEAIDVDECVGKLTKGFNRFEQTINYQFKDKALLLQAFTHPSYYYNELTDCYQRLEFLGDAVLDFLITRQLYEDPKDHSPGTLTDLRSALVNNIYFASLAVKYEYHKYLKMLSIGLFGKLNHFLTIFEKSDYFVFFKEHGYALEEIECFELDEVEIPKALGDLFESVAGAIYIDSGMSLDVVWKVYYPMLAPALYHLVEQIPKSPVRELYEELNKKDIFSQVAVKGEKTYIIVKLPDGKEIEGVGPNKKVAKRSAAKRALAYMKKNH